MWAVSLQNASSILRLQLENASSTFFSFIRIEDTALLLISLTQQFYTDQINHLQPMLWTLRSLAFRRTPPAVQQEHHFLTATPFIRSIVNLHKLLLRESGRAYTHISILDPDAGPNPLGRNTQRPTLQCRLIRDSQLTYVCSTRPLSLPI